jgi:hypothetical protein
MPTITGLASTFSLPQYAGELIQLAPTDTPFFSAIGGLALEDEDLLVASTQFFWQTEDLPAPAQPAILEGANPTNTEQSRSSGSNVVQIFQYGVSVSYSVLGANQQLATIGTGQANPISDELTHQIMLKIPTAKRDINHSFLNGVYQLPTDNTTGRKTRGLLSALTTNVTSELATGLAFTVVAATDVYTSAAHGYSNGDPVVPSALTGATGITAGLYYYIRDVTTNTFKLAATLGGAVVDVTADGSGTIAKTAALTETMVLDLMQAVYQSRGIRQDWEPTIIVGATQKRKLSTIFITNKNYQERSRTIAGVNVQEIETDFGRINIMLERVAPAGLLTFAQLRACRPRFMLIPSKGFLFVEPLAKTGSAENFQLYGEVGLEYGDESLHGKLTGLAA